MALALPTTMIEVPEGQEWIIDMVTNILVEVLASIAEQETTAGRNRCCKEEGKEIWTPQKVGGKGIWHGVSIKIENFNHILYL